MKKFYLKSMGCKSNQFEGQIVAEKLIDAGYETVNDIKALAEGDFYILNSCSTRSARYICTWCGNWSI